MDRGRRACTGAMEGCADYRWRCEVGCSLRVDMDLKNSRCVVAVCEGRSGEPATWDDRMIA